VAAREADRGRARVALGTADDLVAVPLHDDQDPQDFLPTPAM
jgi:hypothetical protein